MTELIAQHTMLFSVISVVIGLVLLVWSADQFIDGAASLANIFGIPTFLIGALIIGFGTSAPEMVVSVSSALKGNPNIALGNAYGSNITNIALVLGATAIVSAVSVQKDLLLYVELPILLGITVFASYLLLDQEVSQFDAIMLMLLLAAVLIRSVYIGIKHDSEEDHDIPDHMSTSSSLMWVILGFAFLVMSSQMLVWGAVNIASNFGVSDLVIGLTVVAIGTSLPELSSSIAAARKGQHEMAIGNIIGSNIFNTLAVVGLAGLIQNIQAPATILTRDLPVMVGLTVLLFVLCFVAVKRGKKIGKASGVMLLTCYFLYTAWLFVTATQ